MMQRLRALQRRALGEDRPLEALLRGSGMVLLMQVGGIGLAYAMQVVVARWAGAEVFGVFAYAWTWMNLLMIVGTFGLGDSALRLVPQYAAHGEWSKLRGLVLRGPVLIAGFATLAGAAAAGVVLLLGDHVDPAYRRPLLLTFSAAPLFGLLSFYQGLGRALGSVFVAFLPRYIGMPALVIVSVAVFFQSGVALNADNLMLASVAVSALLMIAQALALRSSLPVETRDVTIETPLRAWMQLSMSLLSINVCYALLTHCDLLMVGFLLSANDVAVYQAASRTAALIAFPLLALNALVAPMIARLYAEHRIDELQRAVTIATQVVFWPSLLAAIALGLGGDLVLSFFGPGFARGHAAMIILVAGQMVTVAAGPVTHILTMTGHEKRCVVVWGITVVGQFLIALYLIPHWGIAGAAISTMLATCFLGGTLTILVRRRLNISAHALAPVRHMLARASAS